METFQLPWLFAILTAIWFGWMANRAGRTWVLWAVGGAAFGLVASTLVIGLGNASSIPYSEHQAMMDRLAWITAAALLILSIGWLLTAGLHRHRLLMDQQARESASSRESTS
ncbi:MAG TPA: hypothetical protein VFE51_30870 [Verrucomicrobiae bacterium]|nr:hypothetical protein [Verrucomicrobiae bacterium]